MTRTWFIPLIVVGLVGLVIALGYIQNKKFMQIAQEPEGWVFTLPDGDANAGEAAFVRMQCASCHRFDITGETIQTETDGIGPDLTLGYRNLSKEYLTESIIKPHTIVANPTYKMKADQAGMGKYNEYLTVKELMDLVAFLKQPPKVRSK